jgi:hypothetical protein
MFERVHSSRSISIQTSTYSSSIWRLHEFAPICVFADSILLGVLILLNYNGAKGLGRLKYRKVELLMGTNFVFWRTYVKAVRNREEQWSAQGSVGFIGVFRG